MLVAAQCVMIFTLLLMISGKTPLYTTAIVGSAISAIVAGFPITGAKDVVSLTSLINSSLNPVIADMTGILMFIGVMQASGFMDVIIFSIIN
ncbi:hypothetical protein [Campylobacter sputorum]|uniref:hypothetical protein n=1 Tax=Campylobacter sputorum TaxID=206 RepID=UPI001F434929|nr:hypothetical protein [Campylobacter sputorum]